MYFDPKTGQERSAHYMAWMHYARTGEQLSTGQWEAQQEQKYNQNHDERGRFTYPWNNQTRRGGSSSGLASGSASSRGHQSVQPKQTTAAPTRPASKLPEKEGQQAARPPKPKSMHEGRPRQRDGYSEWTQVGSHPAREYRTRSGSSVIDPRSGYPMLVPKGVSIRETVRQGEFFNGAFSREQQAIDAFQPGGRMDFQRTHSTLRLRSGEVAVDQRFVAIGNYNFGVYVAASGMSLEWALRGAGAVYFVQTRNGLHNARNESLIVSGYRDYMSGSVGD